MGQPNVPYSPWAVVLCVIYLFKIFWNEIWVWFWGWCVSLSCWERRWLRLVVIWWFCVPEWGRKILLKKRRILKFFIRDLKTEFYIKFKFKDFLNKLKAILCITLIAFSVTNHWKCDRRTNLVIFLTLHSLSFK